MEKLIKNELGQWDITTEELEKASYQYDCAEPKKTPAMSEEEHAAAMKQYLDRGKHIKKIPANSPQDGPSVKNKAKSTKPKYSPFGKEEDGIEKQEVTDTPATSNIGSEKLSISDNGQWHIEPIKSK